MMDPRAPHAAVADGLESFTDADAALARIQAIYDGSADTIRAGFNALAKGETQAPQAALYPYLGITVTAADLHLDARFAYGAAVDPGAYGTTLTRPALLADYYREQIALLLQNHRVPVYIGTSRRAIPLPFVIENSTADVTETQVREMTQYFSLPDLAVIDDTIANGTYLPSDGLPRPLSLFTAERVDYSIARLSHYTATAPKHFQRFVLLTNYQRYVDEFCAYAQREVANGETYDSFVEPGDVFTPNTRLTDLPASGTPLANLPQMPAYHLTRPDKLGITMINIGVGPSNAKTITDHLAVLRPHCWLMLGHCAGLRRSQFLGDYVLAHGYVRDDQVLDNDLPPFVPVPPIAEVQVALQQAVAKITGLEGADLKSRLRTGSVLTTDNRNWELRFKEIYARLNQSRAIAVDMESATIAANGFRFRVPYGTLLCVSDKPLHGEIKLRGMANAVYRERIAQHLEIGIETVDILRAEGVRKLHSRKLRSFDEPSFR